MRLDSKCNNTVKDVANRLTFMSKIGENKINSKAEECFRCLLVNIFDRIYNTGDCSGTLLLHNKYYKKPPIINGREIPERKVSYLYMKQVVDWMVGNGFITITVGGLKHYDASEGELIIYKRETSKYEVTDKFLNYFDDVLSSYYTPPENNVVILRDKQKEDQPFKINNKVRSKKTFLQEYNNLFHSCFIVLEGKKHRIQLNKIYNISFNRGGRSYMLNGSFQQMSIEDRSQCTLDYGDGIQYKLCELDFRSLHPSILYTQEGITLDKDFDPYGIDNFKDFNEEQFRSLCKLALLILINANSYLAAVGALKHKLLTDLYLEDDTQSDFTDIHHKLNGSDHDYEELAKVIIKAIKDKNVKIKHYFHSGIGAELMNQEADIMDLVVKHFLDKHIITLPVHDSCAIQEDYCDELLEVMQDSYKKVLGTTSNCRIERKY